MYALVMKHTVQKKESISRRDFFAAGMLRDRRHEAVTSGILKSSAARAGGMSSKYDIDMCAAA